MTDHGQNVRTYEIWSGVVGLREGDRYLGRDAICDLLEPWFAARDVTEVAAALDDAGVCWGRYQSMDELVTGDPDCSVDNPLFESGQQPGIGEYLMPHNPLYFSAAQRGDVQPAPALGADTDAILADVLGLGSGEIARLHDAGIVAGPAV